MIYEVYIDKLFFINFMMNFYLLSLVNISIYYSATLKKIMLGAMIGALGFILPLLLPVPYVVRVICGMVLNLSGMLRVVYPAVTIQRFIYYCEKLAIYSFAMGGALLFVLKKLPVLFHDVLILVLLGGAVCLLLTRYRLGHSRTENQCPVVMRSALTQVKVQGILDTGNSLFEPISGKPVCVVDSRLYEALCDEETKGFRIVPYTSIGKKSGIMHASLLEEMELHFKEARIVLRDVYIACSEELSKEKFSEEVNSIRVILHPKLIELHKSSTSNRKVEKHDFQDSFTGENSAQPDS